MFLWPQSDGLRQKVFQSFSRFLHGYKTCGDKLIALSVQRVL
jgi:hypothetical protein